MQRGQSWGYGEYQEYDYSKPSTRRPPSGTWQQQQPPSESWQDFKGSEQFRPSESYRPTEGRAAEGRAAEGFRGEGYRGEGYRGGEPSYGWRGHDEGWRSHGGYRGGEEGWRGPEEWRGTEPSRREGQFRGEEGYYRGKEPAAGYRRGEEGYYGPSEGYQERRPEEYGQPGEWRRASRPRGVSWQAPREKEGPSTYENLLFKPGEVDLNDPYWKLKLEEPTNTWKNYGKRGIELPYYEGWWRPRADIFEEEGDNLRIEFELPGVPTENISLSVNENLIIVTAVKPQVAREERGFYYQNERHFGNFYRKLEFPSKVDTTKVHAHYDNGILKITLPVIDKSKMRINIKQGQQTKEQLGVGQQQQEKLGVQQERLNEMQPVSGLGTQQPISSTTEQKQPSAIDQMQSKQYTTSAATSRAEMSA